MLLSLNKRFLFQDRIVKYGALASFSNVEYYKSQVVQIDEKTIFFKYFVESLNFKGFLGWT